MASQQPSSNAAQKKAGWGSLFSGAVAGLESRLDTILADENDASTRAKVTADTAKQARQAKASVGGVSRASSEASRDASRTRGNDRLAERLAKATSAKPSGHSRAESAVPSRVGSPALVENARESLEVKRSMEAGQAAKVEGDDQPSSGEAEEGEHDGTADTESKDTDRGTLLSSGLPINPARVSNEITRPSTEITPEAKIPWGPRLIYNGVDFTEECNVASRLERDEESRVEQERQDEMQVYMEKIDALQNKLRYLASDTLRAAKEVNGSTAYHNGSVALMRDTEKTEKIVELMEEGEKLSKTEMRHLQTIKRLRGKGAEDAKTAADLTKRLERADKAESELQQRMAAADSAEREREKQIAGIGKQVDELQADRENASELIRTLTTQLKEAKERADRTEKEAGSVDKGKFAVLENELEDAQIEKRLAHDRSQAEIRKLKEELESQKQRASVSEMELKSEIAALESRTEALRSRAEEADTGESNVKLLRQVETLQGQYAMAKENWETIEGSLNARLAAMEKERDEAGRRETDARKKARDTATRVRKTEDALESKNEDLNTAHQDLRSQKEATTALRTRLETAETSLADTRASFDRQRKLWDAELAQRLEEERAKTPHNRAPQHLSRLGTESPTSYSRKASAAELALPASRRPASYLSTDTRPESRRSSAVPPISARAVSTSRADAPSPSLSRHESFDTAVGDPDAGGDLDAASSQSPQRTIADLVSTSATTAGAGPSVQLVERMSAAVRRLESEKATFKDELARLSAQRDAARDEVVGLMREVDGSRAGGARVEKLEGEIGELRRRYDASLEMLGEREEECQELKEGVAEVKRLYRELVEEKLGDGKG